MRRHPNKRTPILILLCLFLVGGWATNLAIAQDQPTPAPSRWPMQVTTSDGEQVVIFQPQIDTFQTNQLTSHAAVSVTMPGSTTPIFGAIWLAARVDVDRVNRTVQILDVQVTNTKFPDATPVAAPSLDAAVRQVLLANRISLSLDHLLTSLEVIQQQQSASAQIQSVPPAIIFLQHPAMLVLYDGTPQLMQVVNSDLMTVVNTPFFVALDPGSKAYFLKGGGRWFSAPDPMGPFAATSQTPPAISTLADEMGYKDPQTPICRHADRHRNHADRVDLVRRPAANGDDSRHGIVVCHQHDLRCFHRHRFTADVCATLGALVCRTECERTLDLRPTRQTPA